MLEITRELQTEKEGKVCIERREPATASRLRPHTCTHSRAPLDLSPVLLVPPNVLAPWFKSHLSEIEQGAVVNLHKTLSVSSPI